MAAGKSGWSVADFVRRHYTAEGSQGSDLAKAKVVEVIVNVDGRQFMRVQLREPGLLALVSKPSDENLDIELIGPGNHAFMDTYRPDGKIEELEQWQIDALGLKR